MKKVILGLLAVIVVLGLFAAAGFAGYRFGYAQGAQANANGAPSHPQLRPFDDFGPRGMPMRRFGPERGFGRGGFPMMGGGFFFPMLFLGRIVILALVVGLVYWLFTRGGWRLTRQPVETHQPVETPPPAESPSPKAENE